MPNDPINPPHYKTPSGLEALDVIEAFDLSPHCAAAFKYIARAGKKGPFNEDIRKAICYLERELQRRQEPCTRWEKVPIESKDY